MDLRPPTFLTILVLTLFAIPALAGHQRDSRQGAIASSCESLLINTNYVDARVPKEFGHDLERTINDLNTAVEHDLILPKRLRLLLDYEDISPEYSDIEEPMISLSYVIEGAPKTEGSGFHRTIFVHEYGHALFERNLPAHSKLWDEAYEKTNEKIKVLQTKERELDARSYEEFKKERDLPEEKKTGAWRTLVAESNALVSEIAILKERRNALASAAKAYSELFADAVAVAYEKNGRAVYEALNAKGDRNAHYRDFEAPHDADSWNEAATRWRANPENQKLLPDYMLLSPTRTFLWKRYLRRPEYQNNPGKVLRILIGAIGTELSARLSTPELSFLNPRELNIRLMNGIEKEEHKVSKRAANFTN